jgi:hypothetical protein
MNPFIPPEREPTKKCVQAMETAEKNTSETPTQALKID